jgi:hypothetical protein
MASPTADFRRGVISPFGDISEAWGRVRDQYWLFVGITAVGVLLGSYAPFGILLGPMMCGIYGCYRHKALGRAVRFEMLFEGFESRVFVQSLIATFGLMAVMTILLVPLFCVGGGLIFGVLRATVPDLSQAPPGFVVGLIAGFMVVSMAVMMIFGTLFAFTYPLIVDRGLTGFDALKLSARAALGNLFGLLGLGLVSMVLAFAGMCCCYIGAFFVLPMTLGAHMVAYENVFGLSEQTKLPGVADDVREVQP